MNLTAAWIVLALATQSAPAGEIGERLLTEPAIKAALTTIERGERDVIADQIRLCEIPAPPFREAQRAAALQRDFTMLGLQNVRIDAVGNVLGERPGQGGGPHLVFSAHLDTVFPEGTNVKTRTSGTVIRGPGIGDDCRGLAVMLGVIRALDQAGVQLPGTITFVGTVGEEGLGDLRGVKHLFNVDLKGRIDRFVSVDGGGVDITTTAVGSRRYRVAYKGPGGHSYSAFGMANPVHALGRAIDKIAELQVPSLPKTTFNVGRVGGGTSVNSIAIEAWMEVDLRSADAAALTALNAGFHRAVDEALAQENDRWQNRGRLTVEKKLVGDRPGGKVSESTPIVRTAVSVTRALGLDGPLDEGSTDSNIAISLGIPAITIGGGGEATAAHSLDEAFDTTDSWRGTARAFLLAVALARPNP